MNYPSTYSSGELLRLCEARRQSNVDTTLIPPGTQYGATLSNPEQKKPPIYAAFATSCNPLQRMTDHS
jgi:hypothetical protein